MPNYLRHHFGLFVFVLVVAVSQAKPQAWAQQASVDPQNLVGEWSGSWKTAGAVQHEQGGRYYLTIEKVEGDKVYGKGRVEGRRARDFNFTGALTGDHLTFGKDSVANLTISGKQMRGKVEGRVNWEIELSKQ
jgi:hypothetical protein